MNSVLLANLEAATWSSRQLDALIECELRKLQAYALGLTDEQRSHWRPIGPRGEVTDHQDTVRYHPPTYTSSIDAALTLVPEGWIWQVSNRAANGGRAYIHNGELIFAGIAAAPNPARRHQEETAATPAIAICIAALKARTETIEAGR